MSILRQLTMISRQPSRLTNLTNSIRSLSITPTFEQKQAAQLLATEDRKDKKIDQVDDKQCENIFNKVNQQLRKDEEGRLFAVVHLCGKQFKVTAGDIILVEGYWPPAIGDQLSLEKVMLAGGKDFTLIGMPLVEPGLVDVKATVIEKTLSHTKTIFKKKRRKQYMRTNFQRSPHTMIRINTINIKGKINEPSTMVINEKQIF
uniref:Large ribosomal subunit protein bL21m n=1 Tax=Glossina palpalis gambiensis TaxID=67801 RepID=A0A1B0BGV8_9MUSC